MDNRPIGIFDSGLGGLTVASEIRRLCPSEHLIYLGDTARVPYGSKSSETIRRFSAENTRFLLNQGVKIIVIACNTASALAIDYLQKEFPNTTFVNVVEAGVNACLKPAETEIEDVAVIGTTGTINSDEYRRQIHVHNHAINVRSTSCPLFVPLIEEGRFSGKVVELIAESYLSDFIEIPPNILLLGCTHYPLIKDTLKKILPKTVKIINSAAACASDVKNKLRENKTSAGQKNKGTEKFYVTDMPCSFYVQASKFWGKSLNYVELIG